MQDGVGEQDYSLHRDSLRLGHDAKPAGDGAVKSVCCFRVACLLSAAATASVLAVLVVAVMD